jgi:hypothetical protein
MAAGAAGLTSNGRSLALRLLPRAPGDDIVYTPASIAYEVRVRDDVVSAGEERTACDFRRTNALLRTLTKVHVGDLPLPSLCEADGVSLWQFLPSYIWPSVFHACELADVVRALVDGAAPDELVVDECPDDRGAIWAGVVASVAATRSVSLCVQPLDPQPLARRRRARRLAGRVRWDLRRLHVRLRARARPVGEAPQREERRLLLATLGHRHWVQAPGGVGRHDEQMSPLLPALRADGWRDFVMVDCQGLTDSELAARNGRSGDIRWRPFSANTDTQPQVFFTDAWERVRTCGAFGAALTVDGIPLLPALEEVFAHAFRSIAPSCAAMLRTARRLLDVERPAAVLVTYETGPEQRALVIESARAGIPTIGLQHGLVFDNHYDYMHGDVTAHPLEAPSGFAVPTVTCLWGPRFARTLIEAGGYPADAVAVTGNWRYDDYFARAGAERRAATRVALGVPPEARATLILSAGQSPAAYFDLCLAEVGRLRDAFSLVRPHPADADSVALDPLLAHGLPRSRLVRGNIVDALAAVDLVVSQTSTVVLEALLLGLPVIVVNSEGLPDFADVFASTGACIVTTTAEELRQALYSLAADGDTAFRLRTHRREFVRDWFFDDDGGAAERVADVVRVACSLPAS